MMNKVLSQEVTTTIDAFLDHLDESSSKSQKLLADAISTLKTVVRELGEPTPREIEEAATRIVTAGTSLAQAFLDYSQGKGSAGERAFAAICASIGFRRLKRRDESLAALKQVKKIKPAWTFLEPLCKHLESLNYLDTPSALELGLQLSSEAASQMPDNSGVRHAHAQFLLETAIWKTTNLTAKQELLQKALTEVDIALALQGNWTKFHLTRGRILLRLPESAKEGLMEIEKAIANEKSGTMDNASRIISYQVEMALQELRDQADKSAKELISQTKALREEYDKSSMELIKEQQGQTIVVVAFMTSVIAIVQFGAAVFSIAEKQGSGHHSGLLAIISATGAMAVILFGATFLGSWLLRRKYRISRD
jgi:vacuolar-type H+-ATPase subunit H